MAIFMQKQFKDNVEISLTLHTYISQQMQMDLENNSHSAVIMLISKHHFPLFIWIYLSCTSYHTNIGHQYTVAVLLQTFKTAITDNVYL